MEVWLVILVGNPGFIKQMFVLSSAMKLGPGVHYLDRFHRLPAICIRLRYYYCYNKSAMHLSMHMFDKKYQLTL